MPHSHHSHSGQFCKHASGTLEDVVLEAIRQGFETYGLTEHVPRYRTEDLYPEEAGMSLASLRAQFNSFLDEAHRLKAKSAEQITLLVGLETENITEADLSGLSTLLLECGDRIEYLVGSIHHVAGIPIDFDLATFNKALESFSRHPLDTGLSSTQSTDPGASAMTDFLCAYYDAQYTLMQRFHPEIIGHFDLCRLYNPSLRFSDYPLALERIRRNIMYAVEYGALFELNAAAFRKGWDAAYPGADVIKACERASNEAVVLTRPQIIQDAGGRFALSDDSHGPHAVGLNYHRLMEYARRMDIDDLWVLDTSESVNAGGRKLAPRKVPGLWWEHEFWERRESTQ